MKRLMFFKQWLQVILIYSLTSLGIVSAEARKSVLQVDASLSFAQYVKFEKVPFILLEGESSTLAEEGLGGYKVELLARVNKDQSFTLYSKIYNYTKSGYTLLGAPSIELRNPPRGLIEFDSETEGRITLQVEIMKQAEIKQDTSDFGQFIR